MGDGGDGAVLVVGGTGGPGAGRQALRRGRPDGDDHRTRCERHRRGGGGVGCWCGRAGVRSRRAETIAEALRDVGPVSRLVLSSIARDNNPIREYKIPDAVYLTTMKLVGTPLWCTR